MIYNINKALFVLLSGLIGIAGGIQLERYKHTVQETSSGCIINPDDIILYDKKDIDILPLPEGEGFWLIPQLLENYRPEDDKELPYKYLTI